MATACFRPNSPRDIGTKCCKIPGSLKNNKLSLKSKSEELLYQKIAWTLPRKFPVLPNIITYTPIQVPPTMQELQLLLLNPIAFIGDWQWITHVMVRPSRPSKLPGSSWGASIPAALANAFVSVLLKQLRGFPCSGYTTQWEAYLFPKTQFWFFQ